MLKEILFPHDSVRDIQSQLIKDVETAIKNKSHIIVHAPTGLGKTASTLPVALAYALKNDLTVFFLTSRHTQHEIAIDTLRKIKEKYDEKFIAIDLVGKQWMCPVEGVQELYSSEFTDYCKSMREKNECEHYLNTKKGTSATIEAKKLISEIKAMRILDSGDMIKICEKEKLCPYELSIMLAKEAKVIVADYYYIFSPDIRETFFQKTGKELEKSIIIVDEAHNLPKRMTDILTQKLSTFVIDSAIKEARKFRLEDIEQNLGVIRNVFDSLTADINIEKSEKLVKKEEFYDGVNNIEDGYENLIDKFYIAAEEIREKQKKSFIGSAANFLSSWNGQDESFARILSLKETKTMPMFTLMYKCLDPSLLTRDVIERSYSTIMMSGTLTPTAMYKDLLGFNEKTTEKEYPSPFPKKNRLAMIVPETTTKFTARNPEQYKDIARITAEICNLVPGNSAIFFPSYYLRDEVCGFFNNMCRKTILLEQPDMNKEEKQELVERFKSYHESGAVLLGVASGSFSQGVDFKGDFLKAVIVAGIPLTRPDLETQQMIEYYNKKYNKGLEYGYFFPAITKCIQSAGRCIRSETDRGVVIFLDERFAWQNYRKLFPKEWDIKTTKLYSKMIRDFYGVQ